MRCTLLAATMLVAALSSLDAQQPNTRQGFWVGAGLGLGSVGADCVNCGEDRSSGVSGYLRLGATLWRGLLVGIESNGWARSDGGVEHSLGSGSMVAVWYPSATGAFFLKVGLGGMTYRADDGTNELTASGPAGSFGFGYEFRVRKNISITPFLNSLATSSTEFKWNGVTFATNPDFKVNLVQVGVGLTWH